MATAFYAAIFGIMLLILSIKTITSRKKLGISMGDQDSLEMQRCIRAHANFSEYTPIFLLLSGYAEINGLPIWAAHLLGMLFLLGRIMHAYSLLKHEAYDESNKLLNHPQWRIRGMMCTLISIVALSIILLIQIFIGRISS